MSPDLHALTGAYVLDALDDEERAAFEAYMATSPATAAEVASLREAAASLAAAAAETPPQGLRRAVMSQIDTVRQLPPVVAAPPAPPTAPPGTAAQAPTVVPAPPSADADVIDLRHRWAVRALGAVAAAAVVLSIGLAATVAGLSSRIDEVEDTYGQVATLLAAPDAIRHEAAYPAGGVVTAVISPGHGAVAIAEDLPPLDEGRVYALWALDDGLPIPIGVLHNGRPLTISSSGLDGLGLTVEPEGPLTLPTGEVQVSLGA